MDKLIRTTAFHLSTHFLSHILGSFATLSPHSMLLGGNEVKIVHGAESGPVRTEHCVGGRG